jgi:class 3 adenylate cyclase/tetratricopeptide (TPR) repeat protein
MRCSRCRAENPAGMRFCGQCAAPLGVACPSCGAVNLPESRSCGSCAAALHPPGSGGFAEPAPDRFALSGEIKQVSVLFCDIVGSTPLTERIGAEAMRDLVTRFLELSIAEVQRYEGTVPQFTGDGFMAVFGAPQTQEDHVRRALLAALGIRQALGGEGHANESDHFDMPIRIGIHAGPVVFGPIGGNFGIETVIGDTANLAARLQQAAEPGTILLSEGVRALAQGYARVEPVGRLIVKGKSEPVSAYRLLDVSRWRSARDAVLPARTTSFVGRDSELAFLQNVLLEVADSHGQAVAIVGEPGIGKSRLLAEFRRHADAERIIWVEGRCLSYGAAIPYLLALDLLRSHCGIVETDTAEAVARKVRAGLGAAGMDAAQDSPVLLDLLGIKDAIGAPASSNPEAIKAKSFEVLQRLCLEGSRGRLLVLALEDLHWVDTVSEELLGALAARIGDARILLLAAYRPEYRPSWAGDLDITEIRLEPLSRDDSRNVVRSVLHGEQIAEPLTEEIIARGEGNPLFLEQLAMHAGEAGDHRADLTLPHSIHGVVMARIDRLPEAIKELLQTAAVIGREFSLRLLRAVWRGCGPPELLLRELCHLEFLDERPDDEGTEYVFRHALTQEAAYGSLLERHRRSWHGAIGHALEELYRGRAHEVAELLALHFGRSDEAEKSVDFVILAAEKAQRRWANSEALNYFNDALHRLDILPDTAANRLRRIDAVLKQAEVKYALGEYANNIEALLIIRSIVDESSDPRRRAAWHYWIGLLHSVAGGRPEIAIEHCQEAVKIALASGLDEIDALAGACLAQVYVVAGRLHDAIEAGERALASFEARGDWWWAARTLWFLIMAANYLGDWGASLNYSRRALEHGIAVKDPRFKSVQALGLWRMGSTYIQQGDLERGLECCTEALALAPIPRDTMMAKAAIGYAEIKAGRVDSGIAQLTEVLAWFRGSDHRYAYLRYALWLAEGHLRRGDCASGRLLIDEVLNTSQRAGYLHCEGLAFWLMGECLAGEATDTAEDHVETAMRILERVGARNDLARAMVTRAALRQGALDVASARRLLNEASSIFRVLGTLDEPARVEAALAALDRGSQIALLASKKIADNVN